MKIKNLKNKEFIRNLYMKIKFITCIYGNLWGTEMGGRPSRFGHYMHSLLSLLKMTDADFICYTSETEIVRLKEYFYEEKFSVFGYGERMDTKKILKLFLLNRTKEDKIKQVNYINNKLLIYQNYDFDIIICKNSYDTKRLYNVLIEFCETNNVNNILFTGSVNKKNRTKTYKRIVEKTGWTTNKTYRTSTRP